MADEVEITNVGGEGGVASEATLASLTRAIEKLAGASGKDPKKEAAKVQKMHTRTLQEDIKAIEKAIGAQQDKTKAVKKATDATNKFSRAISGVFGGLLGSLTGSVLNLSKAVLDSGSSLTDFAQHLPLVGSKLAIFTQVIDQNIEAVRSMSQIGATFGDGLTEIRHIAANAAIPLSDFVDLIQQNSETMKLFGSSTATGASNFAAISKELRQGPGRALMNLGFTSAELNELLIDYSELQNIAFTRDRIQGRITATNAAAFGEELLRISAITGKRRQQIEAELRQQSNDIRVRAALGRMDQDQRERFQLNIADISTESQALAGALIDFSDGIPTTETTRRLMSYSDTFRNLGQDIQNMDAGEFNNFVVDVRQDMEDYAKSISRPIEEVMNSVPGLAEAFGIVGETARRNMLTDEQEADMARRAELERQNGDALMQFGETMNIIRGELMSAFVESGILGLIQGSLSSLAGTLSDFVRSPVFSEGLGQLSTTIQEFIRDIQDFGILQALENLFENNQLVDSLASGINTMLDRVVNLIEQKIFGFEGGATGALQDLTGEGLFNTQEIGTFTNARDLLGNELYERLTGNLSFMERGLTTGTSANISLDNLLEKQRAEGLTDNETQILRDVMIALGQTPNFNNGTPGFTDFGSGTLAMLHGREAVIPLDSPLGQMISGMNSSAASNNSGTSQSNNMSTLGADNNSILVSNLQDIKNELISNMNTASQGSQETIKELNRLMNQVLTVLQAMAEDADGIERNTRSMGGNIANGRISSIR